MGRMEELFAIEGFKEQLKELFLTFKLFGGATCPAPDCDDILKHKTASYTDTSKEPWKVVEVDLLSCKCGFQFRRS